MNTRYPKLINQKPLMCLISCIQMILIRNNIELNLSQLQIASMFDFYNTENTLHLYPNFPLAVDKFKAGVCVKDLNKEFFNPLKINLVEKYYNYHNNFMAGIGVPELIEKNLNSGNDILCGINHAVIIKEEDFFPHAVLINSIDFSNNTIELVTPHPKKDTYIEEVSLDLFHESLEHSPGFISIISKK